MNRFAKILLSVALLCAFGAVSTASAKPVAEGKQQVFVRFERTVVLHDVLLFGEYAIVHDNALSEQGKPCFFIYTLENGQPGKLVTSFHCERVGRGKTNEFKISYYSGRAGIATPIVREIQFAGDSTGHLVNAQSQHSHSATETHHVSVSQMQCCNKEDCCVNMHCCNDCPCCD